MFFFAEHAEPGEKLHRTMRKGVNEHDRLILIGSKVSLDRKGVLNELEEILTREARDGGASYLIAGRMPPGVPGAHGGTRALPAGYARQPLPGNRAAPAPAPASALARSQDSQGTQHCSQASRDMEVPSRDTEVPSRDMEVPSRDMEVPSRDTKVPSRDTEVPSRDIFEAARTEFRRTRGDM